MSTDRARRYVLDIEAWNDGCLLLRFEHELPMSAMETVDDSWDLEYQAWRSGALLIREEKDL